MPSFPSRLTDKFFKSLFGDDIFISYSRADGATYAAGLAKELADRGFSCRLDQWGTESGSEMPESLKKALRRSVALVLVGTEGAAQSRHVADEVRELKRMGRMIVPVVFDGVKLRNGQTVKDGGLVPAGSHAGGAAAAGAREAVWAGEVEGLPMSCESREALRAGEPSPAVLSRIEKTCNFWKKDKRLRVASSVVAALLICLLGASALAGVVAVNKGAEASLRTAEADAAGKRAAEQEKIAAQKTKDAEDATEKARQAEDKAANAEQVADEKTLLADAATKRAEQQQALAEKKTREAAAAADRAAKADERARGAERTAGEKTKLADEKTRLAEEASKEAERQTEAARKAAERAEEARRYADSQEIRATLIDDPGLGKPYNFDRWQRLNDLLVRAVDARYEDGANVIRSWLHCLPPPTVRREVATLEEMPLGLALNNAGTRIGAVYRDRVVIYDAATGAALHSVSFGKPLGAADVVYVDADPFNDRMLFSVEGAPDPLAKRVGGPGRRRGYFFKYFDGSAPVNVNVPEKFERNVPFPNSERGAFLTLKALASLVSDGGVFKDLSREFDGLKRSLSLGENSGVIPLEYDPRTGVGIYKIYVAKEAPPAKPKPDELEEFAPRYSERVVLYDGRDKVTTLYDGGEKGPDDDDYDGNALTFVTVKGGTKLVVKSWGDGDTMTALNTQKRLAIVNKTLFRFSEDWRVESSAPDLPPLDGVNSLKFSEEGGTVVIYFGAFGANTVGLNSKAIGVFDIEGKTLRRFFPPEKNTLRAVGPRGKHVLFVSSAKKLEEWDTSTFSSNGWLAEVCTTEETREPAEIPRLYGR